MIDPQTFAQRQMELTADFAKYVLEHPEIDATLPEDSYIYSYVDGESEFNEYSEQLAHRREQQEGVVAVCVRLKGLKAPQGSRLIDPEIVASPNVA